MGVRIHLAGAEVPSLTRSLFDGDVEWILYSYFWIQKGNKQEYFADLFANNPSKRFILDSGAFTYRVWSQDPEKAAKLPSVDDYWESYIKFVRSYGHLCYGVAELDVDEMVSDATLVGWREELLDAVGPKAMPVWHPDRGPGAWKAYLSDPRIRYLGIASNVVNIGMTQRMVNQAHQRGKMVHGFGQTKINTMLKYVHFDTVDSTSWLAAQKFGQTFIFRGNKFIVLDKADAGGKNRRRLYKSYFQQIGCNWDLIEADDVKELRKASVIAWKNLSLRMASMRWPEPIGKPITDREELLLTPDGSLVAEEIREWDDNLKGAGKNRVFRVRSPIKCWECEDTGIWIADDGVELPCNNPIHTQKEVIIVPTEAVVRNLSAFPNSRPRDAGSPVGKRPKER